MCRRFMAEVVKATGSADQAGLTAGRSIGLVPAGIPAGMTTPPEGHRPVAHVAVDLARLRVGGPIGDSGVSVLALGVEAR